MYTIEAHATESFLWCYPSRRVGNIIKQHIFWLYIVFGLEYLLELQLEASWNGFM